MSCGMGQSKGAAFGQHMVDQKPKFDNQVRKRKRRRIHQVLGPSGLIRPDKRMKAKFL